MSFRTRTHSLQKDERQPRRGWFPLINNPAALLAVVLIIGFIVVSLIIERKRWMAWLNSSSTEQAQAQTESERLEQQLAIRENSRAREVEVESEDATLAADVCQAPGTDDFQPMARGPLKEGTIFVSVASYRDDECRNTVRDAFEKASRPERIFVGIVQQNKLPSEDCLYDCAVCTTFHARGQIRVMSLDHLQARGPTFARFQATKLYDDEEYYMQIDSHSKFEPGWDETVFQEFARTADPMAVLGHYPPTEQQMIEMRNSGFSKIIAMCHGEVDKRGVPIMKARYMNAPPGNGPIPMPFIGANNLILPRKALIDVPFDPYLAFLFFGEEILYSARLVTSGFNIYTPRRSFLVHAYGRKDKPKFWTDLKHLNKPCQPKAILRMLYFFGRVPLDKVPAAYRRGISRFGMGSKRSLEGYLRYAGISFADRKFASTCKSLRKFPDDVSQQDAVETS